MLRTAEEILDSHSKLKTAVLRERAIEAINTARKEAIEECIKIQKEFCEDGNSANIPNEFLYLINKLK